jgi:hypothetical protein
MSIYKLYILFTRRIEKKENRMKKTIPVLLTVLLSLSACGQTGTEEQADKSGNTSQEQYGNQVPASYKPESSSKIVARVNGVPIYEDELNGMPVDSLVTDEIFYQEGLKEGLEKKFQKKIRDYQMTLVVTEIKKGVIDKMPTEEEITDKDLRDYYNSVKDSKYTNYRIEEIIFQNESQGEQIIEMAKQGKSFQDIANSLSNAQSQVTANDLGYNNKMRIYFDAKEIGSISKVVPKEDGAFSVLKITEVKETPYNSVKNIIKSVIKARRKGAAFDQAAQEIAKENGFTVEIVEKTSRN